MNQSELAQLIEGVKAAVEAAFLDRRNWTDAEWNSSAHFSGCVFPEFRRLAESLKYDIRFSAAEPRNFEFLYDVSFLKTSGSFNEHNGYFYPEAPLRRVVLVLECEWSPRIDEIMYDFSKLLVARADLRCLVFYRNKLKHVDAVVATARAVIAAFEQGQKSDRYLLCGLHALEQQYTLLDGRGEVLAWAAE